MRSSLVYLFIFFYSILYYFPDEKIRILPVMNSYVRLVFRDLYAVVLHREDIHRDTTAYTHFSVSYYNFNLMTHTKDLLIFL